MARSDIIQVPILFMWLYTGINLSRNKYGNILLKILLQCLYTLMLQSNFWKLCSKQPHMINDSECYNSSYYLMYQLCMLLISIAIILLQVLLSSPFYKEGNWGLERNGRTGMWSWSLEFWCLYSHTVLYCEQILKASTDFNIVKGDLNGYSILHIFCPSKIRKYSVSIRIFLKNIQKYRKMLIFFLQYETV